jgi:UPF0755 protein
MTKKIRGLLLFLTALVIVFAATIVGIGAHAWNLIQQPYQGYSSDYVQLEIERGTDARAILDRLEREGVLANSDLARIFLIYQLQDPPLQAGEYRFEGPLTTPEVLSRIIDGRVVRYPVTIIEGLTVTETAEQLSLAGFGDRETFEAAVQSNRLVEDLDPQASNLEGYLFPDTYSFAKGTTEWEIVRAMVDNFRRRYETEVAPLIDADDSRTLRETVILASIVEKEARLDDERALVAGVYVNRLRRGIALYADPTIIYGLKLLDRWDGNLRRDDLKLDSPYNTYIHAGLTPGPIASPGLASLQAAAQPADVPYLYFVARNDGSHVFAETLAEHNRNVYKWQKLYWRKRWAEEKAAEKKAGS